MMPNHPPDTDLARRLTLATQAGLPLTPDPWSTIAAELGVSTAEVLTCVADMLADGRIRRIGAVPNHYAIGYVANGMSVWDISDEIVDAVGQRIGALDFVTHCYRRPRSLPEWRYNLFAMVHDRSREAALARVRNIADLINDDFPGALQAHEVLFSSAILKKTGLRLSA